MVLTSKYQSEDFEISSILTVVPLSIDQAQKIYDSSTKFDRQKRFLTHTSTYYKKINLIETFIIS